MAEGVVRGVAYRPRQRVLLAARLECRLAAGSRPRNGNERRSLALWAVRESNSHWLGTLSYKSFLYIATVTRHHLGLVYYPDIRTFLPLEQSRLNSVDNRLGITQLVPITTTFGFCLTRLFLR